MLIETLLDVTSFLDYATLVALRLTEKQLLCFVDRYAEQLAFRRSFVVSHSRIDEAPQYQLEVGEVRADNTYVVVHTVEIDGIDIEQIAEAASELQSHIGPHAVQEVELWELNFCPKILVARIPALRYAAKIRLDYVEGFSPPLQEYIEVSSLFERQTWIDLSEIPIEALVVFLRSASASRLTSWSAWATRAEESIVLDAAVEDVIFRSCFDFSNHEQGEARQISFAGWNLRRNFLRRLIEAAVGSQRDITIAMSTPSWVPAERIELRDGFAVNFWRLPLDPESFEEKCVAIRHFLRYGQHRPSPWTSLAYFSKRSDVVVFVKYNILTITNNVRAIDAASGYDTSNT